MSTKTRNLSNIEGANVGNPDMNDFTSSSFESYASDAAFEADHGVGQAGDIYWNTTNKCIREHNGTAWQFDKTIYSVQTDSTTTGSSQDITPNTVDQVIRFTHGSLVSIRSISPAIQRQMDFVNGQASQSITISNEDLTATAANRIVTGIGSDVTLLPGQACRLIYDSAGLRWRLSGALSGTGSGLTDWASLTNNLSIAATVAANALTISLKDKAGSDPSVGSPVLIGFRNSTQTTGTYNVRTVTSALSVVVSNGSTLGTSNAIPASLWVYALDNAGTVELAVSSTLFDTSSVQSTTAEGGAGAADSATVIYSTTSRSNVPMRIIGKIVITEATAGVWATSPTIVAAALIPVGVARANSNEYGFTPPTSGEVSLTFSASTPTATPVRAIGIYYQDISGNHRMRFNISYTVASAARTLSTVTITGTTFKNVAGFTQAAAAVSSAGAIAMISYATANTGTLSVEHASATTVNYHIAGDVELDSRPSWA